VKNPLKWAGWSQKGQITVAHQTSPLKRAVCHMLFASGSEAGQKAFTSSATIKANTLLRVNTSPDSARYLYGGG